MRADCSTAEEARRQPHVPDDRRRQVLESAAAGGASSRRIGDDGVRPTRRISTVGDGERRPPWCRRTAVSSARAPRGRLRRSPREILRERAPGQSRASRTRALPQTRIIGRMKRAGARPPTLRSRRTRLGSSSGSSYGTRVRRGRARVARAVPPTRARLDRHDIPPLGRRSRVAPRDDCRNRAFSTAGSLYRRVGRRTRRLPDGDGPSRGPFISDYVPISLAGTRTVPCTRRRVLCHRRAYALCSLLDEPADDPRSHLRYRRRPPCTPICRSARVRRPGGRPTPRRRRSTRKASRPAARATPAWSASSRNVVSSSSNKTCRRTTSAPAMATRAV